MKLTNYLICFLLSFLSIHLNATNLNEEKVNSLLRAINNNHLDKVKLLIDHTNVNADLSNRMTPLTLALHLKHEEIVKFLLENNADKNKADGYGFTPLRQAILNGNMDIIKLIIDPTNVDADIGGMTPLTKASRLQNREMVEFLLKNNADKNKADSNDFTALDYAICFNELGIVKLLIDPTNVNAYIGCGMTPLEVAVKLGHKDIVEFLLKNNADVNKVSGEEISILHSAAKFGDKEIIELLLERGANWKALDREKMIPLHYAIVANKADAVMCLLTHPAITLYIEDSELTRAQELAIAGSEAEKVLLAFKHFKQDIFHMPITYFTHVNKKYLNLTGVNERIPVELKIEEIPSNKEYSTLTFSFNFENKQHHKTMVVKPEFDKNNPYILRAFQFCEVVGNEYIIKNQLSFREDNVLGKKSRKGKRFGYTSKALFKNGFLMEYNKDLGKWILTITTNSNSSEILELGRDKENLAPVPQEKGLTPISPSSNTAKSTFDHQSLLGTYEGTSTYHPVAYAEITENRLWLMFSNNEILEFTTTINGNDKVTFLQGITNFGRWHFAHKFEVYLEGDTLVLECSEAKKANRKQPFVFRLKKTTKARPIIISVDTRETYQQVPDQLNTPATKQPKVIAEAPVLVLSKNQIKNKKRKLSRQQAQENLANQQDLMPNFPEAKSASNFPPVKDENEQDVFKNSPPQSQQTVAHDKNPPSLGEKDFDELLGSKLGIKLKPTPHSKCPLFQEGPAWEGVARNMRDEPLNDKKLIFSLKNLQGRNGVWGSLWATALGKEDNYTDGKNIHWSYHKQDNGDEYLYISHHYLFKIIKSYQDNGYTLELVNNKDTNRLNDVKSYKVYPKNIQDITPSYVMEHLGVSHNEVHEEELLISYNETYKQILEYLVGQNYKLSADDDLYFISEKTWELIDIKNNKKTIIKINNGIITIENKKNKKYRK